MFRLNFEYYKKKKFSSPIRPFLPHHLLTNTATAADSIRIPFPNELKTTNPNRLSLI